MFSSSLTRLLLRSALLFALLAFGWQAIALPVHATRHALTAQQEEQEHADGSCALCAAFHNQGATVFVAPEITHFQAAAECTTELSSFAIPSAPHTPQSARAPPVRA